MKIAMTALNAFKAPQPAKFFAYAAVYAGFKRRFATLFWSVFGPTDWFTRGMNVYFGAYPYAYAYGYGYSK